MQRLKQIGDIPENSLSVSFDVLGFCSHIRYKQRFELMGHFFDKREDASVLSESRCKLANILLKHNYFELGKTFLPSNLMQTC